MIDGVVGSEKSSLHYSLAWEQKSSAELGVCCPVLGTDISNSCFYAPNRLLNMAGQTPTTNPAGTVSKPRLAIGLFLIAPIGNTCMRPVPPRNTLGLLAGQTSEVRR